jgi:hypothetical protein
MKALKMKNKGGVDPQEFRKIFKAFNEMNKQTEQTGFELQIPDMGLAAGEATAVKIVAVDRLSGVAKGGITLVITG